MPSYLRLRRALRDALTLQSEAIAQVVYLIPENVRGYNCKLNGCERPAYARRLCNAHYVRRRNGKDLHVPLRARRISGTCWKCGGSTPTSLNAGWGLCANHYTRGRRLIIKRAAMKVFGELCCTCGKRFQASAFDFHHRNGKTDKKHALAYMMINGSVDDIAKELAKCDLICANCHRIEHSIDDDEHWIPTKNEINRCQRTRQQKLKAAAPPRRGALAYALT